jgi:hypothetical protein
MRFGHSLLHYVGDAVAPDTKTDTTLDSGAEGAAKAHVEPNIKEFDALGDWKGKGSEKKKQKCDGEEEGCDEAEHSVRID